jgi:hypothetical protein
LWLALGVAVSVRTLVRPASHTVFPIFAAAAQRWWSDRPLYQRTAGLDDFRYPPTFAVAVTPLAWLGLRGGGVLWSWLSGAVLLAGLWRFAREVLPGDWPPARVAALLALVAFGALRGLWNAQSNALVVGLLLLAAADLVGQRWWRAAFLLSASVWVKLTPLAPALLFCALWPRRLAPRFALALAVVPLFPFLTRPPDVVLGHYLEWLGHLTSSGSERWPGFRDAWTVWQVLRHAAEGNAGPLDLCAPLDSSVYRATQLLAAAAALGWCLWQRRCGRERRWLVSATLAMGCAWLMLFGPAAEHAAYVFLAPSLAWAVLERRAWPAGRQLVWGAFVLVMLLGWGSLTRPVADRCPAVLAALPVGTALLTAWLVGYARTRPERAVEAVTPRREWRPLRRAA